MDDLSTGRLDNLAGLDLTFVAGSLLDPVRLASAFDQVDSVVHLAALGSVPRSLKDPMATHAANATGTLRLLEAARAAGVDHVVISSSSSVYGSNPALPKGEREWVRPMSPTLSRSLRRSSTRSLAYQQSFGMSTLAFRFFNVYGPGQMAGHVYATVIPTFIDALLRGEKLRIYGDGTQSRDFNYVGMVSRVLFEAVTRRVTHDEPVNLVFGPQTTLRAMIGVLESVTGRPAELEYLAPRAGDVKHSLVNNSVLRRLFPGVEAITLNEGIAHTVAWFEERMRDRSPAEGGRAVDVIAS